MITNLEATIREYLPNVIHMSLATSKDNIPWITELHYAYDKDLNIYFRSTSERRQSKEILLNKNVAGSIIEQHDKNTKPRGIYFEGTAEELKDVGETNPAYLMYCERFGTNKSILEEAKKAEGHKFYKIKVNKFYIFDARESNPSQKYELDWKKI